MKWILAAAAACALTATPAFAAGSNSDQTQMNQDSNQTQPGGGPTTGAGTGMDEQSGQNNGPSSQGPTASQAMTQQKLSNALNQAGFNNIHILGGSYLIQAQDSQGNTVYMAFRPGNTTGATTGSGGSGANGMSPGSNGDLNPNSNSGSPSEPNNNQ